jgi:hypothetical protein
MKSFIFLLNSFLSVFIFIENFQFIHLFDYAYSFYRYLQDESSVQTLIENCIIEDEKLYICVSSPTIKNKPVQIRPWRLSDADFVLDASMPLDPRKTVFVGGVPRPLKAGEFYIFCKPTCLVEK